MAQEYIYAVARIKARELTLLARPDIDRLMACKTPGECLRFLADKGWGSGSGERADEVLARETEKTWALMHELVPDLTPFHILLYPIDFNNLKAAVKCAVTGAVPHEVFMPGGTVAVELMEQAVRQNDFSSLPDFMAEPAERAMQTLLQTRDGQRCDLILDRACLEAIRAAGKASGNALIEAFAALTVDTADIKIAARAMQTGKSRTFLEESLAESEALNLDSMMTAALKTPEDFYAYLSRTDYADAVEPLKEGASSFEKWCDERKTALVRDGRHDYFTVAALIAYVIARQTEIATVRIILSGKQNSLDDGRIRERLREMV